MGGDFNTNKDQEMFAKDDSLTKLLRGGFRCCFEDVPLSQRVTHPGKHPYPNATFDYLLGKNVILGKPLITKSDASDHLPVTCEMHPSP